MGGEAGCERLVLEQGPVQWDAPGEILSKGLSPDEVLPLGKVSPTASGLSCGGCSAGSAVI